MYSASELVANFDKICLLDVIPAGDHIDWLSTSPVPCLVTKFCRHSMHLIYTQCYKPIQTNCTLEHTRLMNGTLQSARTALLSCTTRTTATCRPSAQGSDIMPAIAACPDILDTTRPGKIIQRQGIMTH